ncbi:beta strand repeat-containing protein [Erythrobacter aurantius]|uniref:beta strand repeat-containing protein n=1 Tax=Erythrobacter aurantius TaxID=2909249 RepID=UPI00207A5E26|nr:hypothetical protein [Erythrobacter aurantius]
MFDSKKMRTQLSAGASIAILAVATASVPSSAQTVVTNGVLDSILQGHVTGGDTSPQSNSETVTATTPNFDAITTIIGDTTNSVLDNNENTADATAIANRNGVTASLATIGSTTLPDDGIALSAVSTNTGQVDATTSDAQIGVAATDFATGSVNVLDNVTSSVVVVNEGSDTYAATITGSEPVDYTNLATTNAAVTTDVSGSAANVADLSGSLLVSSVQVAVPAADSSATTSNADTFLTINTTADDNVTGTTTLDGNAITSSFTANARDASIALAADDGSTSTTAAISNAQRFDANTSDPAAVTTGEFRASIQTEGFTTSFLNSSLSAASNTASANATGNTATTQISLADSLSYNTAADNIASAQIDELGEAGEPGDPLTVLSDVTASGGLVGVNTQLVQTGELETRLSVDVDVDVASLETSSIDVSSNRLTTAANGNDLTAGISSGASSATFDASAVLASRQELDTVVVLADSDDSDVEVNVGQGGASATFVNSAITVDSNVLAASATGNRALQAIELEATALNAAVDTSATLSADLIPSADGDSVAADGAVVIASAMFNTGSTVTARNTISDIDIFTGDNLNGTATNTSVAVTRNTQQAFATGSDAGNSLSLTGVDVGSAAGISNLQVNDATSTVTATQTGSIDVDYAASLISGSSEISGNSQSAVARGTVAANTLSVDAQVVALGLNGTAATSAPQSLDADATAAYGVVNVQQVLADVIASADPDDTDAFRMDIVGSLTDSNTAVTNNTLLAQAQGTVATNQANISIGNLTTTDGMADAAVANLQNVSGADILATADGNTDEGGNSVETEIDGAILRGSVVSSANQVLASADSSRATNTLTVSGTSLSGSNLSAQANAYLDTDTNTVAAQFGVVNTQVAGTGNVTASLRESTGGTFGDSASVVNDLNSTVTNSSVEANNNLLQALAASNRSTNTVSVDGTTLNQVTAGASNLQTSSQDVSALIGFAGSGGVAPFTVPATITTGTASGSLSGLTPDQVTAFLAEYGSATDFTYDPVTFAFSYTTPGTGAVTLPVSGTSGAVNNGGVLIDVEGAITASTLAVESNAVQGSAIGNSAGNSVTVAANAFDGVTAVGAGEVLTASTGDPEADARADAALASSQILVAGSSSTTEVFTTFGIDGALDTAITDASLSVSANSAYGEAIGNTVTNNLTVRGTDLAGTATSGVLTNSQDGSSAAISSVSDMEVVSNVVSSGSSVNVDQNGNSALGVINNATNSLTASSTNSTSTAPAIATSDVALAGAAQSTGSFALINGQNASGTLTTTATTDIYNIGNTDVTTTGVVNGSISMSSNATRSESTSNRAANTVSVGADANLGSTASLINQQASQATTSANANSTVRLAVTGTTEDETALESLDGSSVLIEGNSTLALARGNSASNTLNYTAGAGYTAAAGAATINGSTNVATANAALLNDQANSGAVTANATGGTSVALNATSGGSVAGVLNASVSNSNNSTTAFAVGNSAENRLMLSSLVTGMPNVALGNQQTNTGAVSAVATTVTYSMSSNGAVAGSSMQNSGNAASATAIGNSSISVIGAN